MAAVMPMAALGAGGALLAFVTLAAGAVALVWAGAALGLVWRTRRAGAA
jgi:hypothetical protein